MKNILSTLLLLAFAAFCLPLAAQDEDFKISIQGTLKDANSLAVEDGQQTITFRLYDAMTGGTVKHEETADVQVRGGVYNYLLGTNEELEPEDFVTALYLSLEINGNELFPRTQMTYSPYSLSVSTAQQAIRLTSGTETCSGSVGDIKHSILNPTEFADENGDCWVPMDGRNIPGTKLADTYGWSSVPDMSGLFVRATEYNVVNATTGEDADPERNPNDSYAYQADEIKAHEHMVNGTTNSTGGHSHTVYFRTSIDDSGVGGGEARELTEEFASSGSHNHSKSTSSTPNHSHTVSGTAQSTGGPESRPKNMNFYIYIRVD